MKPILKICSSLAVLLAIYYLLLPVPSVPPPPPDSLTSQEPADTESIYRSAYYTDFSRAEVINYYTKASGPFYLNQILPPENAGSVIRDQTRSSWLEELVIPLKAALYINGYYPTKPTDQINLNGKHWQGKITIRRVPSHPITRLTVLTFAVLAAWLLAREYARL